MTLISLVPEIFGPPKFFKKWSHDNVHTPFRGGLSSLCLSLAMFELQSELQSSLSPPVTNMKGDAQCMGWFGYKLSYGKHVLMFYFEICVFNNYAVHSVVTGNRNTINSCAI